MGRPSLVLVTGGSGFIGKNLVNTLISSRRRVTVYDLVQFPQLDRYDQGEVASALGDILDLDRLVDQMRGHDSVVHLAAQTGVPNSVKDPLADCRINVIGTLNVLEAARRSGIKRVVFASSSAPLGRQTPPATEDKAPLPVSPYGASKLAGEGYCLAYHGSFGLETVVLRFSNVYGPEAGHKESVVAKFIKEIIAGRSITIDGDGQQTRDFIFTGDLCRAIVCALETTNTGEIYQIASGVETSISSLASSITEISGRNVEVITGETRVGDVRRNYSEISKAKNMLGWSPEIHLQQGLETTWNWFQSPLETRTS